MQSKRWRSVDNVVDDFAKYMLEVRGQAFGTQRMNGRCIRDFLDIKFGYGVVDVRRLTPRDANRFILKQIRRYKPRTVNCFGSAVRMFFRFLQTKGIGSSRFIDAVPKIPQWKLSSLPTSLTRDEIQKFLKSFDRSVPRGRRDYAIALCLVYLGLRAGEVADLTLEDIDWRAGTLQVPLHKTRRRDLLPLPQVVGAAIARYLRNGRPQTPERRIFVGHCSYHRGRPFGSSGVQQIVRAAFDRAGLKLSPSGAHVLRHTAATQMLRRGASIKEIADVLRHRDINTTVIYTKVDLPTLRAVALPWPGVRA